MFSSRDFDRSGKKIEIFMVGIHPERGETGQIAVRNPVFDRGTEEWGYRSVGRCRLSSTQWTWRERIQL